MNCIAFTTYHDAQAALGWLEDALGFERTSVHGGPDGTIAHAELRFGDGMVMLGPAGDNHAALTGGVPLVNTRPHRTRGLRTGGR